MSLWFNDLQPDDRLMVAEVVRNAAHAAVFGMLCILDDVAVVDNPPHAALVLTATEPDGGVSVLASPDNDLELHDEFNASVHPPSEPWPPPSEWAAHPGPGRGELHRGYLETSRRIGVWPDSVQVFGGVLSFAAAHPVGCGSHMVCDPSDAVGEAWLKRGLPSS